MQRNVTVNVKVGNTIGGKDGYWVMSGLHAESLKGAVDHVVEEGEIGEVGKLGKSALMVLKSNRESLRSDLNFHLPNLCLRRDTKP